MDMVLSNDAEEIEALLERGYRWDGVIWWENIADYTQIYVKR